MASGFIHQYPVRVEPHLTDYAGVVWHGSYLRWLEEARIDALRQHGMEYADLVALGCDLPVIKMELNYCRSLRMGDRALVRSYILRRDKIRMIWSQNVYFLNEDQKTPGKVALEAKVTLIPLDMASKKIMRRLPEEFENILKELKISDQNSDQ